MKKLFLLLVFFISVQGSVYVSPSLVQKVETKYGPFAKKRFYYLDKTLMSLQGTSDVHKLTEVNTFYNEVGYQSDIKTYNKSDYWATPWEFLSRDLGDCEDYVIAKYFALIYLGIDPKKLYFTYVRSSRFKGAHMVLTYFKTPSSVPLVLDNNNFKVLPASRRPDLTPIYNFNGAAITRASGDKKGKKVKSKKVHKQWDQLLIDIKGNKI